MTDPYHALRAPQIADEVGLQPARVAAPTGRRGVRPLARETAAVSLGRIIGYRRLASVA